MHEPNEEQPIFFGYQPVTAAEKTNKVKDVFDRVTEKYDLMNDLMSLGLHRLWKKFVVTIANVREGHKVLDLAGGTGDLTQQLVHYVGDTGFVCLADINHSMLAKGRDRLIDKGFVNNVVYTLANAEDLPFLENSFDCICIGFGLRNVTHIDKALVSMYKTLKPGGKLLILEFSKPINPVLQSIYDFYSFQIIPGLGKLIAGTDDSYRYLVESIRMHPDQGTLKRMLQEAGFENCEYFNLAGGIVAVHRGYKF